jgi:SAM-dependent methyltransferase
MRLDEMRNERGEIWLNIASSHYAVANFLNLDNHISMLAFDYPILVHVIPRKYRQTLEAYRKARMQAPFARHDCRKRLPLPDSSVDHILCSHFLEHVYPNEAAAILEDFHRVLKGGATMHIVVPDLEALIEAYIERRRSGSTTAGDEFLRDSLLTRPSRGSMKYRILELLGGFGLQHRWMYDRDTMRTRIEQLGFAILSANDTPSRDYRLGDGSVHIVAKKASRP